MIGIIACLILIACGSDNNQANSASSPQSQATQSIGGGASFGNTQQPAIVSTAAQAPAVQAPAQAVQAPAQQIQPGTVLNPTGQLNLDIRNVIKAARPAVVLIAAEIQTQGSGGVGGLFGSGAGSQIEQGVGTGSILTQDGYILTNNHVVEGATKLTVVITEAGTGKQTSYPGRLIGREGRSSDMAIVKIDPKSGEKFPTIPMGDATKLEVGEAVVAIGNALGLPGGPTVTAGIVGAIGRSIQEPGGAQLTQLIQTDAAINPGNSGGPLLNLRGEIIGMNTAAAVDQSSGQGVAANGIGFALNINQTKQYIDALLNGGGQNVVSERPFMGILPQTNTAGLQARYKLPLDYGVLISRVDPNTPAAQAGWTAGDLLVRMDNTDIRTTDDLANVLSKHKAGDRVNVTLVGRDGKQRDSQITFGKAPQQ